MWPPTITPCECTEPGFCNRHQCWKPPPWLLLCRLDQPSFDAWERGVGPGQQRTMSATEESGPFESVSTNEQTGPNVLQRAWNFGNAVVRHVADGGKQVDDAVYETRLEICRGCASCDVERMVCREPECGCFLNIKARWSSEKCPKAKWPSMSIT